MKPVDWDAMAAPWLKSEAGLELAHQSVLDGLLRRAALAPGERVLDIGCGTGASLLAAVEVVGPQGQVTGVDISPPIAARARQRVPRDVEVIVGDAGTLEYDRPFDTAISMFGTLFFADTAAAFRTIRKALRPGGRLLFTAWGAPPRNPWFGIPRAAVEAAVGPLPKPDPGAPGPFRFADASATAAILRSSGFDVEVETEALVLRTGQDAAGLAGMHLTIAEALLLGDRDLSEEMRASIRSNLREGFARHQAGESVEVPAEVHYFMATAA